MLEEQSIDWTREWREAGRKEGEAVVLMRQFERKFGTVSEEIRQQINEADCEQLLIWADRILTADRIEDVLTEE